MQFQREQIKKKLLFQSKKVSTLIYVNKLTWQWKPERKRNHQLEQKSNKSNACMTQFKRGFLNIPRVQSLSQAVHNYSASCGCVWSLSCWRALESDPRCPCAVSRQTPRHGFCVQLLLWNMRDLDETHKMWMSSRGSANRVLSVFTSNPFWPKILTARQDPPLTPKNDGEPWGMAEEISFSMRPTTRHVLVSL